MNHHSSDNPPAIETVQEQFETWRSHRSKKREPIPRHLWQAAAKLCQEYPPSYVSKQLRLSYADLKKQIPEEPRSPAKFIEIDAGNLAAQWQIECARSDGSQLRMKGNGQPPAVETVLKAFLP